MPQEYTVSYDMNFTIEPTSFRVFVPQYYNDVVGFNLKRFWKYVFHKEYVESKHRINETVRSDHLKEITPKQLALLEIIIRDSTSRFPTDAMNESCK